MKANVCRGIPLPVMVGWGDGGNDSRAARCVRVVAYKSPIVADAEAQRGQRTASEAENVLYRVPAIGALIDDMSGFEHQPEATPLWVRRALGTQFPPGRSPSRLWTVDSLGLRK